MNTKTLEEISQIEYIKRFEVPEEQLSEFGDSVLADSLEVEKREVIYSGISRFSFEELKGAAWIDNQIKKQDILIFSINKKLQIGINNSGTYWCQNKDFIRIRCFLGCLTPPFLHFWLEHKREELENLFDCSLESFCESLKKFKLSLPKKLTRQTEIVESFNQFDEFISYTRRELEIREQQFWLFKEKLFSDDTSTTLDNPS